MTFDTTGNQVVNVRTTPSRKAGRGVDANGGICFNEGVTSPTSCDRAAPLFLTTRWSVVSLARDGNSPERRRRSKICAGPIGFRCTRT